MKKPTEPVSEEAAQFYLRRLKEGSLEESFHGLCDLDHDVVPFLIEAYRSECSVDCRRELLAILAEFRTPLAVPLLADALRANGSNLWKTALDALVVIKSPEAIRVLREAARSEPDKDAERVEWCKEALEQALEANPMDS